MSSLVIHASSGTSTVYVAPVAATLKDLAAGRKCVLVVDRVIEQKHGALLPDWPKIIVNGGEETKNLVTVENIYRQFMDLGVDKSWLAVGVGGGTLCDMTGFAASTWLRGLRLGLVPTTLLAQVDAGIGGKNGVNFGGFKNQIGTIYQPEFVICDPAFLASVSEREIRSGLAEIIKAGLICDASLIELLQGRKKEVLSLKGKVFEEVLHKALKVKAAIVEADEMERGDRVKLNFGHTIGHGIEAQGGLTHGEAVSVGMMLESQISCRMAGFSPDGVAGIRRLLTSYNLPVEYAGSADNVILAMRHDKKRSHDSVKTALLEEIGVSKVATVSLTDFEDAIYDMCGNR